MSDDRDIYAIEPPTYRPGNPMWDAGWRACQAQAAVTLMARHEWYASEVARNSHNSGILHIQGARADEASGSAEAILAMRPTPPTLPPGMNAPRPMGGLTQADFIREPRDYPIGHPVAGER